MAKQNTNTPPPAPAPAPVEAPVDYAQLLKDKDDRIAELEKTNREQAVQIDDKDDVIDELKKANQEQEKLIEELTAAVDQQDSNGLFVLQTPIVEHEGEKYEVVAKKFSLDGAEYTLNDLTDPAMVAKLIARQSGVLRKIA